jgi:hypothetical protein
MHTFPTITYGDMFGTLLAGVFCGLVPLLLGILLGQFNLARQGAFVCLLLGCYKGLILAGPAAGLFVVLIVLSAVQAAQQRQRKTAPPPPPVLIVPPVPTLQPGGPPTVPGQAPVRPVIVAPHPGGLVSPVICPSCARPLPLREDRPPPWCPGCGADVR